MRKIIEILSQLIISTAIFGSIFYAALPKYDHAEVQNALRNHAAIMFRVHQGLGKFLSAFSGCWQIVLYFRGMSIKPEIDLK